MHAQRDMTIQIRDGADKRSAHSAPDNSGDSLFETVFRDSPDGILVADGISGTILEANDALRGHLGVEPRRLTGRTLAVFEAGYDAERPLLETVRAHGAASAERDLRRIDGSVCRMHVHAAAASWNGRPVIIVTLRDVRDRQRAQEARRKAEERYRSIFDNAIEGIFQTTPDGAYLTANAALARMYGYASPEALIADLTDIAGQLYVDPTRRGEFRCLLEEHDAVHEFESEIRRRDGAAIWISENARAVRDPHGALLYYEGTVIDISTRKCAEAARRDEAQVARALADFGREMMASIDSPHILVRLCRLSADALGCDWAQSFVWESEVDAYVPVSSGEGGGTSPLPAIPRAALDGLLTALEREEVLVVQCASSPLLPEPLRGAPLCNSAALCFAVRRAGVCVGVLMVGYRTRPEPFTDVQRRIARGVAHLASVALEHARVLDELARANKIKSEFLATMSHELRTPLHIILGYNDVLRDEISDRLTSEQREMLHCVGQSAGELLALINATLDLSRLEAGQVPLDLTDVNVRDLLGDIEADVREFLRGKAQLRFEWELAAASTALRTDAGKLKVILRNLIHNAVKFTDAGGIVLSVAPRADGIEFCVCDTGLGIPSEALPVIFDAFRQVDGSMTRRHGGVGLGLHVVKRLVELLNGSVSVQSRLGEGSTFRVWLPAGVEANGRLDD